MRTPPSVKTKFESVGDRKASGGNFFTIVPNYQKHRSHHQGPPSSFFLLTMHAFRKQLHTLLFDCMTLDGDHTHTTASADVCRELRSRPNVLRPATAPVMQERTAAVKLFFNFTRSIIAPQAFVCSLTFRYLRQTLLLFCCLSVFTQKLEES